MSARARDDIELMQHADGELDQASAGEVAARLERDPDARAKVDSLEQVTELVRGHLELHADAVHDAKFTAMWLRIDDQLEAPAKGLWSRLAAWFDRYRGYVITGAASAGAVAALALILRPAHDDSTTTSPGAIDVRPVALRAAPEIDSLDTPDETSTVINLEDEDGHTTVIWVNPTDTVEGI